MQRCNSDSDRYVPTENGVFADGIGRHPSLFICHWTFFVVSAKKNLNKETYYKGVSRSADGLKIGLQSYYNKEWVLIKWLCL